MSEYLVRLSVDEFQLQAMTNFIDPIEELIEDELTPLSLSGLEVVEVVKVE